MVLLKLTVWKRHHYLCKDSPPDPSHRAYFPLLMMTWEITSTEQNKLYNIQNMTENISAGSTQLESWTKFWMWLLRCWDICSGMLLSRHNCLPMWLPSGTGMREWFKDRKHGLTSDEADQLPLCLCCMAVKWLMRKYVSCWSSFSLRTEEASNHTLMVTFKVAG